MLFDQIVSGVLASSIYALYAVGFALIFGIMRVLNMAHGDFGTIAAFSVLGLSAAGFSTSLGLISALCLIIIFAMMLELIALRPARRYRGDAAIEMPLIATIGAGMVIQNLIGVFFGNRGQIFPLRATEFVSFLGVLVPKGLVISLFVAILLLTILEGVVHHTSYGRQLRAVAQNRKAALIMGINVNLLATSVVVISSLLAAIAGLLVGATYGLVDPYMAISYSIKGLVAMIVGGVGSLHGAVAGALILGLVEALAVTFLGSQMRDPSVALVLVIFLAIRPSGLFPAREQKV